MRKGILIVGAVVQIAFAFQDSDLDGVEDSVDRCPGTPILELVDRFGCPIEKGLPGEFLLRLGGGFVKGGITLPASSTIRVWGTPLCSWATPKP